MAKKIYMTNSKGGCGVTTCCIGLGIALAEAGERTLIVDGDSDCASALTAGGCSDMQVYTLKDFASGACRAKQTLVPHPQYSNLTFLSSMGVADKKCAADAVKELDGLFDYILLDKIALACADEGIVVSSPYLTAVKGADNAKSKIADSGIKEIGLIVNALNGGLIIDGLVMTAQETSAVLHIPLKGVIPEDLLLPLGRCKSATKKAFKLTAETITGKGESMCNVLRPYFGLSGIIKRKVRESL